MLWVLGGCMSREEARLGRGWAGVVTRADLLRLPISPGNVQREIHGEMPEAPVIESEAPCDQR